MSDTQLAHLAMAAFTGTTLRKGSSVKRSFFPLSSIHCDRDKNNAWSTITQSCICIL